MQSTPHACLRFDELRSNVVLRAGHDVSCGGILHQDMYFESRKQDREEIRKNATMQNIACVRRPE